MIFVTLGTHEQPFNRLISEVNRLINEKIITTEVFMQVGFKYSTVPVCKYEEFISLEEMDEFMQKSEIIIVHGGPGSIMQAFINKKVPIVVPRQREFGEHVDNHQVFFTKRLEEEKKVIAVYDIKELGNKIIDYNSELARLGISGDPSRDIEKRAAIFSEKLDGICHELIKTP